MKYIVELNRIHKSSPFNCSGYIPEVECENEDDVINHPEVQELIKKTYGKNFVLMVTIPDKQYLLEYSISKPKAIID